MSPLDDWSRTMSCGNVSGMGRQIRWTAAAEKDLGRLDYQSRERVRRAVARFAETGYGDIEHVQTQPGTLRLRVGDLRVLFRQAPDGDALLILRVLPRGRAYR